MAGMTLRELGITSEPRVDDYFVKAPVFPFGRFPREDTVLGPEMKSTGEVMGSARTFGEAYAKALLGAGTDLPLGGTAFISVNDNDKRPVVVNLAGGDDRGGAGHGGRGRRSSSYTGRRPRTRAACQPRRAHAARAPWPRAARAVVPPAREGKGTRDHRSAFAPPPRPRPR